MKILICPDSFKGVMTAHEAAQTIREGIKENHPDWDFSLFPVADGGEGTMSVLVSALGGEVRSAKVQGPLFEDRIAEYGITDKSIIIESASACALPFVPKEMRNPLNTSTYGVGLLIKEALKTGKEHIILTIGGIATNDCGIGCLAALGVKFYDKIGNIVNPTGGGLGEIHKIDGSDILPQAKNAKWTILCDVDNYLYGEQGAAYVFGPQKGATPLIVKILDDNLRHFAHIVEKQYNIDIGTMKHGGAAGGFAAGLSPFFDLEIVSGTDYILNLVDFKALAEKSDIIITGEGRVDSQTFDGKIISGILKYAKGKEVIVIGGCVTEDGYKLSGENCQVYSASEGYENEYSIIHAKELLKKKTMEIFK